MSKVIHFEIVAKDPERAVKFYTDAFGWQINRWEGGPEYWLVKAGEDSEPGIGGAIMRGDETRTQNTITVSSIEEYSRKVTDAGGKVITEKQAIPGVGYFAYCTDPEGMVFGILQPDMSLK